nr:uncharacterized protein LOC117860702 [Setaria viridis]
MFWKGLLRSRHGNVPGWKRTAKLASCAHMESFEKIHGGSSSAIKQTRTTSMEEAHEVLLSFLIVTTKQRSTKIKSMHSWRCGKSIAKYVFDMVSFVELSSWVQQEYFVGSFPTISSFYQFYDRLAFMLILFLVLYMCHFQIPSALMLVSFSSYCRLLYSVSVSQILLDLHDFCTVSMEHEST